MKKIIALVLSLLMVLSLVACGGNKNTESTKAEEKTTEAQGAETKATGDFDIDSYLPIVKDGSKPKLTIAITQKANVTDYEDNEYSKWLEEKSGCELDFVMLSTDATEAKQQIALWTQDMKTMPDIIIGPSLGTVANEYGEDEIFANLKPYYDDPTISVFWHDTWANYQTNPSDADKLMAQFTDPNDGGIYGVLGYEYSPGMDLITNMTLINKAWLEAVGITKVPETISELHDALVKMVNEDPNKNGQKDEMGVVGSLYTRGDIIEYICNAYIYCNWKYFWTVEDGKITVPYVTDEWRQAMIEMNKWYKEGILSPLCFTNKTNEDIMNQVSPASGTSICAMWSGHPTLVVAENAPNVFDYVGLMPLKDETGKGGYAQLNGNKYLQQSYITNNEHAELSFRICDLMYSQESMIRMRYGEYGREFGFYDIDGETYGYIIQDVWSDNNAVNWHLNYNILIDYTEQGFRGKMLGTYFDTTEFKADGCKDISLLKPLDPDEVVDYMDESLTWSKRKSALMSQTLTDPYLALNNTPEVIDKMVWNAAEQEIINGSEGPSLGTLQSNIKTWRANFVTGEKDPSKDADWKEYLDLMDTLGIELLTKQAQSCYDRMSGK